MFHVAEYPRVTSNTCVIIHVPAITEVTPTVNRVNIVITDDNSIQYPIVIQGTITGVSDAPVLEKKPRWEPELYIRYARPLKEIAKPWQAKWRLKQQRPRDGLR